MQCNITKKNPFVGGGGKNNRNVPLVKMNEYCREVSRDMTDMTIN